MPIDTVRPSTRRRDLAICAVSLGLLLGTILYRDPQFRESLRYTLQGLALAPIFFCAIRYPATGPFRIFNTRVLARIGVLSYGIYLIHSVVLHAIPDDIDARLPSSGRVIVAVTLSVVFATIVDRCIDPYFRRRRAALH
jgi:peptidoglycan/LPS O-acetylase OafA/YrhL